MTKAVTQLSWQSWQHDELGALVLSSPWQSSFAEVSRNSSDPLGLSVQGLSSLEVQQRCGQERKANGSGRGSSDGGRENLQETSLLLEQEGRTNGMEEVLHLGGRGASEPGCLLGRGGGVRSGVTDRHWHHWLQMTLCRHEHGLWDELLLSAGRKPRNHTVSGSCGWVLSSGKFPRFTMLNYIYSYLWLSYIPFMGLPHSEFPSSVGTHCGLTLLFSSHEQWVCFTDGSP